MSAILVQINSAILAAQKAAKEGRPAEAAKHYRLAATLLEEFADDTPSPREKEKRRALAAEYRALAREGAERPAPPGPAKKSSAVASQPGADDPSADDPEILNLIRKPTVRWADVGGLEETKAQLREAFVFALGKMPEGVRCDFNPNLLLVGPPGTGKTLLAAAVAGELQATFFEANVSSLLSKFFGETNRRIAALYRMAAARAPAVVFFDEFDALARSREGDSSGVEVRMLSQILQEMDGLRSKSDNRFLMTIAATNRPWSLDDAVLSRFARTVHIPLPDDSARRSILKINIDDKGWCLDGDPGTLVERTAGYAGREIAAIVGIVVKRMLRAANPDCGDLAAKGIDAIRQHQLKVEPLPLAWFEEELRQRTPVTSDVESGRFERWMQ